MSRKIENAKGLYLEGIRDGKVREAVTKYTGARYTQHSTGVADGVEGFVAFFEPFIERCPVRDISVVRAIEDGQYVFVHVYQDINNGEAKWVTADLFDTDQDDRIIEHWDCIQAFEAQTVSGRSMVDGPTEVEDLERTEENKALVREFCEAVLVGGQFERVAEFISQTRYDQHNPHVADGLEGFGEHVKDMASKGIKAQYVKIHHLMGQGNFVVTLSEVRIDDDDWCIFDIFRVKDGKIVEHWDVQEKILKDPAQWGNSGKF